MALLATLNSWQQALAPYVNAFVIFFLVMFIGFLVGKIVGRLLYKFLHEIGVDAKMRQISKLSFSLSVGVSRLCAGAIYVITTIIALKTVGALRMVLGGILLIVAVAVLLSLLVAVRDFIPNIAGWFAVRSKARIGSRLKFGNVEGKVQELKLLETVMESAGGEQIVIPNMLFSRGVVLIKGEKK